MRRMHAPLDPECPEVEHFYECLDGDPMTAYSGVGEGRNVKQVQHWLGHSDPGFTLRTYVGLLDGDLGGPLDLDAALFDSIPSA